MPGEKTALENTADDHAAGKVLVRRKFSFMGLVTFAYGSETFRLIFQRFLPTGLLQLMPLNKRLYGMAAVSQFELHDEVSCAIQVKLALSWLSSPDHLMFMNTLRSCNCDLLPHAFRCLNALMTLAKPHQSLSKNDSSFLVAISVERLASDDKRAQMEACQTLATLTTCLAPEAEDDPIIEILLKTIGHKNDYIRAAVCKCLSDIYPAISTPLVKKQLLEALLNALTDVNARVRKQAMLSLAILLDSLSLDNDIGPIIDRVVATWTAETNEILLSDVCEGLAQAVIRLTSDTHKVTVINAIITRKERIYYSNINEYVSERLGEVIASLSSDEGKLDVINQIAARLRDRRWEVKQSCCISLGHAIASLSIAVESAPLVKRLRARLYNRSSDIRQAACEALARIGVALTDDTEKAVIIRSMISNMAEPDGSVRHSNWRSLAQVGVSLSDDIGKRIIIEDLILKLRHDIVEVREGACNALGSLAASVINDLHKKSTLEGLIQCLTDIGSGIRRAACIALAQITATLSDDSEKTPVVDAIIASLADISSHGNGWFFCMPLAQITVSLANCDRMPQVISMLEKLLSNANSSLKNHAWRALAYIAIHASNDSEKILVLKKLLRKMPGFSGYEILHSGWLYDISNSRALLVRATISLSGEVGKKQVFKYFMNKLRQYEVVTRVYVCQTLGMLSHCLTSDSKAKPVVNALIPQLIDTNKRVRSEAGSALGQAVVGITDSHKKTLVFHALFSNLINSAEDWGNLFWQKLVHSVLGSSPEEQRKLMVRPQPLSGRFLVTQFTIKEIFRGGAHRKSLVGL